MSESLLTIGIAVFEDFEGLWMTLESLHMHHPRVKYLVIDNAPKSCPRTRAVTEAIGGRYLHRPDLNGTSAPRDALFRLADSEWVMCLDSHVLLETKALKSLVDCSAVQSLLDYIKAHPDSRDLIQGPLIYDDGKGFSTHWRPTNPPGLWGTWDAEPLFVPGPPFDIPMQGLGLFAMRRQAWPGFHPLFRGFGGEEGYIHEKVRQRGGRTLCLPALRWRHRFRHMEHGAPPPPYRLAKEDHVWNLLLGHRELGIDAVEQIRQDFGQGLPAGVFEQLQKGVEGAQAFGKAADRKRLRLLGVWYSNNSAPEKLLQASLGTIQNAVKQTMHHDVVVTTSAWKEIPGNPFPCAIGKPDVEGHAAILQQIETCLHACEEKYPNFSYDGVAFLEQDVLYSPGHFDRMGDALATGAPVVSNLDYEGLNETGWLAVKERHEPFHQLSMRCDVAMANLTRCEEEVRNGQQVLLEPQGDRADWIRLMPQGLTPAIHVNHPKEGRLTNHGEVVFEASSHGRLFHSFWQDFRQWWPLEAKPSMGCGACNQQQQQGPPPPPVFPTIEDWFQAVKAQPSDFHEHMETLRTLASKSDVAVELSTWLKPAILSLATGRPKKLVSVCPGPKPEWTQLGQLLAPGTEFVSILKGSLDVEPLPCDLLFIDTRHQAEQLHQELTRWGPSCRKHIVIHTTVTFGEKGDDGTPGVLVGIRRFLKENKLWFVAQHFNNNHGLTVLSCDSADKKKLPGTLKMAWNYSKALAKHALTGSKTLAQEEIDKRLDVCLTCEQRVDNRCSACGCFLDEGPNGEEGKATWREQECPLGMWPPPTV